VLLPVDNEQVFVAGSPLAVIVTQQHAQVEGLTDAGVQRVESAHPAAGLFCPRPVLVLLLPDELLREVLVLEVACG
jgi:hypothetical protein